MRKRSEPLDRALISLDGLSVGDAFGDQFFHAHAEVQIDQRLMPHPPWEYTDDTETALAIVDVLADNRHIDEDLLAHEFGLRYEAHPNRGYGATAHSILRSIANNQHWRSASSRVFEGMGSMGNGAAMRSAPIGAYFAGDPVRIVDEAKRSAIVTHFHEEGRAGAIAVALAAGWAAQHPAEVNSNRGRDFFEFVLKHTPNSGVRDGIYTASQFAPHTTIMTAVALLGNGLKVTAPDTVPFCLWAASKFLHNFEEAMWFTLSALGDRDTTCAIVGGIVALSSSTAIPKKWIDARRPLEFRSAKLKTPHFPKN
jgi:ADP-ribosylglycohydrolase